MRLKKYRLFPTREEAEKVMKDERYKRNHNNYGKVTLSIYEAAAYTGIGLRTLSRLSDDPDCDFILMVGSRKAFKRKKLEEYLESHYVV